MTGQLGMVGSILSPLYYTALAAVSKNLRISEDVIMQVILSMTGAEVAAVFSAAVFIVAIVAAAVVYLRDPEKAAGYVRSMAGLVRGLRQR